MLQQREFINTWCDQNKLILTKIFADVARPGSSTISRDQFRAMIDHFRDSHCTDAGLILWKFSRFSRDIDDAQYYRADLRRRGFVVHSLQDNIPDTTDGRIYEALLVWMNNKFLEDMSIDVKRGLRHSFERYGVLPGTPPRGFIRQPIEIGKRRDGSPHTACKWVPDPITWDLCKQAWMMRAQGIPIRQIHKDLHLFSAVNSYTTFFSNRLYIGEMRYGEVTKVDYVEPMISQEIWDMVQALNMTNAGGHNPMKRNDNPNHPRRVSSTFLLSGLIYCPRCGSIMTGVSVHSSKSGISKYYLCSRANRNTDCDARRIPKEVIENTVIEKILEYVLDPKVIHERDKELALSQTDDVEKVKKEISKVMVKMANNERKRENVSNRIAESDQRSESLMDMLEKLESEYADLKTKKQRLISIQNHETVFIRKKSDLEKLAKQFKQFFTSDDPEKRRQAIKLLVDRVAVERDGKFLRGIIRFFNPSDPTDGFMSMDHSSVEAQLHRHKIFELAFVTPIKQAR